MLNTLNRLRVEMGLSRPKMLELVGEKPTRLSLFSMQDSQVGVALLEKARELKAAYGEWVAWINGRLDEYERRGITELTSAEIQDLLDLRDLHIAQLRFRGTIKAIRAGYEYTYAVSALRELVEENSTALARGSRIRGPLAYGFLRWLGRQRYQGLDLAKTGRLVEAAVAV